jgi:hypothetical protein
MTEKAAGIADHAARSTQHAVDNAEHTTSGAIRHFALHRIDGTELRVIPDIETGVTSIIEVEEAVLRRYVVAPAWPHQTVSLFVLSDLSPLQRQLARTAKLPPGGIEGLGLRPIVNVYDLANANACHVFVNQSAMLKEGYWGDRLSETALLAHEHAHPLAENATTQASRLVTIAVRVELQVPLATAQEDEWTDKLRRLLQVMVEKLCAYAPREVFTNDLVLRMGFAEALHHLDLRNVANAVRGVQLRPTLVASLDAEPALTPAGRAAFLAVADLKAYPDLALEIASFHRLGYVEQARSLDAGLVTEVFPRLVPETAPAYRALVEQYRALRPDMTPERLVSFSRKVIHILSIALEPYGVALTADIVVQAPSSTP